MNTTPQQHFARLLADHPALAVCRTSLWEAYERTRACFASGGKLLLCGNGGSAADCEHIVGELMKGFLLKRSVAPASLGDAADLAGKLQGALPALSLTGQPALNTAYQNDVDPAMVFAQQVFGYGVPGDVLLGISTSGNAENVAHALRVAKARGLVTLGLTGAAGGRMKALCDVCLCVPETETYRVQELHLPVYHAYCAMLESAFFGDD